MLAITIGLGVAVILFLALNGFFSGAAFTSWLIWGVAPATLFTIVMVVINFWEIREWLERRSRR